MAVVVDSMGGLSTDARTLDGLKRISEANLKHGHRTKEKLAANRHSADKLLRTSHNKF